MVFFGKAPAVVHGRAQEPFHADHIEQCACDSLPRSRRRCGVAHARLEVLGDLRAVSDDHTVRRLDRRHRNPACAGHDVLEEPGCRRGDLAIGQPILDQVAARLARVQRQRRAVERDRFFAHQDSHRSIGFRVTIFRQIARRVAENDMTCAKTKGAPLATAMRQALESRRCSARPAYPTRGRTGRTGSPSAPGRILGRARERPGGARIRTT